LQPMNIRYYYGVLLLVVAWLSGCKATKVSHARLLAQADTLVEHQPDSALHLLATVDEARLRGRDHLHALYVLLKAKASYKCYQPVPADSLLSAVTGYYETTGNLPRLCDAIYYRAMPLYEQGCHEQAAALLKRGESMARQLGDQVLLSKYYESLCMVNYKGQYDDLMLHYAKRFLANSLQRQDTTCIARAYSHVSTAFSRMHRSDSALWYITKAKPYVNAVSDTDKAFILTNMGSNLQRLGHNGEAKKLYMEALSAHPRHNTYCALGKILREEGDTASAQACWRKAMQTSDPEVRIWTLSHLCSFHKSRGRYYEALVSYEAMTRLKDSLAAASEQAKIAEVQLKYDREIVENEKQRFVIYFLAAVIFCLLMSIATARFYHYHQRKVRAYQNTIEEDALQIKTYEQKLAILEKEGCADKAVIAKLRKKSSAARQAISEKLARGLAVYERAMNGEPMSSLTGDDRCFIDYFSVRHYDRYEILSEKYAGLSPRLMAYVILKDMGKTDDDTANILGIKKDSLRSIKKRVNDLGKGSNQER